MWKRKESAPSFLVQVQLLIVSLFLSFPYVSTIRPTFSAGNANRKSSIISLFPSVFPSSQHTSGYAWQRAILKGIYNEYILYYCFITALLLLYLPVGYSKQQAIFLSPEVQTRCWPPCPSRAWHPHPPHSKGGYSYVYPRQVMYCLFWFLIFAAASEFVLLYH